MTVYVLMLEYEYEPSYLRGVYSSLESAKAALALVGDKDHAPGYVDFKIYPVELDALPLDIMAYFKAVDPAAP